MCASSKILLSLLLGISQCTSIAVALSLRVSSCAHGSIKQHSFPCDDGYRHVVDKRRRTVVAGWLTHFSLLPFINVKKCHAQNLPKATGADLTKTGTTEKLAPILELEEKLRQAAELLKPLPLLTKELQSKEVVVDLSRLLSVIPTHEGEFKRLFDEYSDPISYKQKYLDQNAFLVYYTKGENAA